MTLKTNQTLLEIALTLSLCIGATAHAQVEMKPVKAQATQDGSKPAPNQEGNSSLPEAKPVDLGELPTNGAPTDTYGSGDSTVASGQIIFGDRGAAPGTGSAKASNGSLKRFTLAGDEVTPSSLKSTATATDLPQVERVQFARRPITVALGINRERLITLPGPAVFHVPDGIDSQVSLQILDRTVYATALQPFGSIRVIAEVIATGVQIPLNLIANKSTIAASPEIEVFMGADAPQNQASDNSSTTTGTSANKVPMQADMVQLTRYASRMLYAPRRLAPPTEGVQQVSVETAPVDGLIRGAKVNAAPVGQWRSGNLYVTAVRVTNLEKRPLVLNLEGVRGSWVAATAQHGRLGPVGTDADTTAVYLVCNRPFNTCR